MNFRIAHLYPDLMNTYGDMGNIIALRKRCQWRGIDVEVKNISVGDEIDPGYFDFYFFGGGQDWQQNVVAEDLKTKEGALHLAKANKAVFLSVCGGYQLLGNYYQPFDGEKLYGAGLIDCYTKSSSKRMIGNLVISVDPSVIPAQAGILPPNESQRKIPDQVGDDNTLTLVGFENHSGQTFLGEKATPLGKVLIGFGNNGEDYTEGAIDGTAFGCYLHGSLLPKNPHFADYLIKLALQRRHTEVNLKPLDDSLEYQAHETAIARAKQVK